MKTGLTQLMFAGAVFAATTATLADTVRIEAGPAHGTTGGGEFQATILNGAVSGLSGSFLTFCIEKNEPINIGAGGGNANVYDFTISDSAHNGGAGGPNPDPISFATAYLFTQFTNGTLSNYAYNGTTQERIESANAFQYALWQLEEESGITNAQADAWVAEALAAVANASIWGETLGDVRVMTLTKNGNSFQDMLTLIPLPPSAWMGLASLAGVGVLQVRRRLRAMTSYT